MKQAFSCSRFSGKHATLAKNLLKEKSLSLARTKRKADDYLSVST
jgi:hypothetical protein